MWSRRFRSEAHMPAFSRVERGIGPIKGVRTRRIVRRPVHAAFAAAAEKAPCTAGTIVTFASGTIFTLTPATIFTFSPATVFTFTAATIFAFIAAKLVSLALAAEGFALTTAKSAFAAACRLARNEQDDQCGREKRLQTGVHVTSPRGPIARIPHRQP
jgi:hypothetical protein